MDRFIINDDGLLLTNCDLCSRVNDCNLYDSSAELCVRELIERLYKYESKAAELESKIEKLKSNPVLGKFFK